MVPGGGKVMTGPTGPISVQLVEDDSEIREGLERILGRDPRIVCSRCFGTAEEFFRALKRGTGPRPDLVLMDIELPGCSGIEATRRLRQLEPTIDVVMLTIRNDDEAIFESLCAGAVGFLLKSTRPSLLPEYILQAREGGSPMSLPIARRVALSFRRVEAPVLTDRERQILAELCQGKGYKEIGADLFISPLTVHSHLKNIYRKLEVRSKNEAVAKALKEGWI